MERILCGYFARLVVVSAFGVFATASWADSEESSDEPASQEDVAAEDQKRVIGATAILQERTSSLLFLARVDTGAKSTSIHVEEMMIPGKAEAPREDIGKVIKFQVRNSKGQTHWIDSEIKKTVRIKTSDCGGKGFEVRYKVPLTLRWNDIEKEVLVTLNDRSGMNYSMLLGRDFLRGEFLVDVEKDRNRDKEDDVQPDPAEAEIEKE